MELKYTGSSHLNAVSSNTVILGNLCFDTGQFTDAGFSHEIVVNTLIVNMEYIRRVQFVNKITDKNNVNNQSYKLFITLLWENQMWLLDRNTMAYHSHCAVSITQQGFFKSLHTSKARTLCTEILVTYLLTYIWNNVGKYYTIHNRLKFQKIWDRIWRKPLFFIKGKHQRFFKNKILNIAASSKGSCTLKKNISKNINFSF